MGIEAMPADLDIEKGVDLVLADADLGALSRFIQAPGGAVGGFAAGAAPSSLTARSGSLADYSRGKYLPLPLLRRATSASCQTTGSPILPMKSNRPCLTALDVVRGRSARFSGVAD
ncbi:hypothetical protein ABID19_003492 [Mesorhizobium robiniae]|uniref:Uncharacterized protein n=1 Tax=Mesorhizobium robiniae TaxID=559315 RepID=A0ABV2GQ93_9HYPH